jgi:hypothetical protein
MDLGGVENGDDHDCHDVVDNGKRSQEDLQPQWDAVTKESQHAEGEGDVGRHGDAPTGSSRRTPVQQAVDHGRDEHTTERGNGRQGRASGRGQLADKQLALDLQTNDEEKDRHQPVVDPMMKRHREMEMDRPERKLGRPHCVVGLTPRCVGPEQRDEGTDQQEDATEGLVVDELAQRKAV